MIAIMQCTERSKTSLLIIKHLTFPGSEKTSVSKSSPTQFDGDGDDDDDDDSDDDVSDAERAKRRLKRTTAKYQKSTG